MNQNFNFTIFLISIKIKGTLYNLKNNKDIFFETEGRQ